MAKFAEPPMSNTINKSESTSARPFQPFSPTNHYFVIWTDKYAADQDDLFIAWTDDLAASYQQVFQEDLLTILPEILFDCHNGAQRRSVGVFIIIMPIVSSQLLQPS